VRENEVPAAISRAGETEEDSGRKWRLGLGFIR